MDWRAGIGGRWGGEKVDGCALVKYEADGGTSGAAPGEDLAESYFFKLHILK